jgi:pimeloyl-ACP methyl ester carboxylesterase
MRHVRERAGNRSAGQRASLRQRLTQLLDPATATGSAELFVRQVWRVIRSNVMNLDYQIDGPEDAPVIVLSNSLGTTRAMWQPQLEALTQHFRVLRYDTHGHGATRKNGKVTLAQLGEDVIALLDHLNIAKAWFCGISMGGLTGLWLGRFAPNVFRGWRCQHRCAYWRPGRLAVARPHGASGRDGSGRRRRRGPLVYPRISPEDAGSGGSAVSPADPYRC